MATTKTTRRSSGSRKRKAAKPLTVWKKRLIAGLLVLFSLLVIFALLKGQNSLLEDMRILGENDAFLSNFFSGSTGVSNLMGVFGAVFGFVFVYLFGYVLSLVGAALFGLVSLQYFLDPRAPRSRRKGYLLIIVVFLLQILLTSRQALWEHSVIPLACWKALSAVFSVFGATLLLWVGMALTLVLIFEWQRIKRWALALWEDFRLKREQRQSQPPKAKPTINADTPVPVTAPVIQNHAQSDIPYPDDPGPVSNGRKPSTARADKPSPPPRDDDGDDDREYVIPSIDDFLESPVKLSDRDRKEIENQIIGTSQILKGKLSEFGIEAEVRNVNIGPIITQYELEPARGVKVNKFTSLADDLALAIKAKSIRVQAPIPGRGLIGIEIPNLTRDMIYLRDLLLCEEMRATPSKLAFGLGKDIAGRPVVTDLAKMPHLLIAGATGSGKSVCINTIIMSLILRTTPDDLRLILIDPKRVELAGYGELPHLIGNVVTEPDTALENMYWAVKEMERRYELLQEARVRDISGYNERAENDPELDKLPYIVIIVDEFADLILTSGKDIELPITRLAQMARAVGIHLILATQRPSIKVITGIIKANFSARIAFQVSSRVDSRVILDQIGAERLLGSGDMLFLPPGKALPERIHGAFVSDHEIARVCDFLAMQPKPRQDFSIVADDTSVDGEFDYDDDLFPEAARVVVSANTASVSMLQRHFRIGYARAGRLIDLLERARIIGPHLGSKSRDVIATTDELERRGIVRGE